MRRLRAEASTHANAKLAVDMFTYRVVRESGAMLACMQGLDVLAFSGGIGEHDVTLRAEVGARLAWLGLDTRPQPFGALGIDPALNASATGDKIQHIHAPTSAIEVWVVPTDEGVVTAREAASLLNA